PAAPSNFAVSLADSHTLHATWTDNANNEDSFQLEVSVNGHSFQPQPQVAIPANATSANLDLAPFSAGDVLAVRAVAVNAAGRSPASNSATATVPGGPNVPAAPTNFQAVLVSPNLIRCTWTDNANNETGFLLEDAVNLGPWEPLPAVKIPKNATSVQFSASLFSPGDQVGLRVRGFNAAGKGLPSGYSPLIIPGGPQPPTAPRGLVAKPGAGAAGRTTVHLTYQDRSNNEDGFRIEVASAG